MQQYKSRMIGMQSNHPLELIHNSCGEQTFSIGSFSGTVQFLQNLRLNTFNESDLSLYVIHYLELEVNFLLFHDS